MDKSTAYNVLGLQPGANEDQIKVAYRELAKKYSGAEYEVSPLKEDAARKMDELNEAFDTLMSLARGADSAEVTQPVGPAAGAQGSNRYTAIRQLINQGQADEALAELQAVQSSHDAEWNFLMGSAYYYKGHLQQALFYFQQAVQMEPANPEYQAALRNLTGSASGEMPGNPYRQDQGAAAMNCACNTCGLMCCMDACCSMCRGF